MLKNTCFATRIFVIVLALGSIGTPQGQSPAPQLGKNSLKEVIAAMTVERR